MEQIEERILIYAKDGNYLKPIKIYYDEDGNKWIEAHDGTEFVIEVKNNTIYTILASVTVDGLSVINGKPITLKGNKVGYVLDSKNNLKIEGWRTSLQTIRKFKFTFNKKESYSHKLGADEKNIGVIGFAFYYLKCEYIYNKDYIISTYPNYNSTVIDYNCNHDYDSANINFSNTIAVNDAKFSNYYSSPCNSLTEKDEKYFSMATKQGDEKENNACYSYTNFNSDPFLVDKIFYDSRENLIRKGIIKKEKNLPKPFIETEFCPDL